MANKPTRAGRRAMQAPPGSPAEFVPDYSYVRADLRRIALLAGSLLTLLVVLSFFID